MLLQSPFSSLQISLLIWAASNFMVPSMLQVRPTMICMGPTSTQALRWLSRHCSEAKGLDLHFLSADGQMEELMPNLTEWAASLNTLQCSFLGSCR